MRAAAQSAERSIQLWQGHASPRAALLRSAARLIRAAVPVNPSVSQQIATASEDSRSFTTGPSNTDSVISGREVLRPRNTTPSPYPALCRAGSTDGQFHGNALGRACSLTCRNSRRSHTAGTSEEPARSPQAPRTSHTHRRPDRRPRERGTRGNTLWSGTGRSIAAARIR
jgi:hypothetical protein